MSYSIESYGLLHALGRALKYPFRKIRRSQSFIFFIQKGSDSISTWTHHNVALKDDINIVRINGEMLARFESNGSLSGRKATRFAAWLGDEGRYGFAAVNDKGEMVGHGWVAINSAFFLRPDMCFDTGDYFCICHDLWVKKSYRHCGIGKALNRTRLNSVPADRRVVASIDPANRHAIKGWLASGMEECASTTLTIRRDREYALKIKCYTFDTDTARLTRSIYLACDDEGVVQED